MKEKTEIDRNNVLMVIDELAKLEQTTMYEIEQLHMKKKNIQAIRHFLIALIQED